MSPEQSEHTVVIDLKNTAEFSNYYNRFYARLCFYAFKMMDEPSAAEDVVNEVFVRMLQQQAVFQNENHLKSYLYRAVRNSVLNVLRAQGVSRRMDVHYYEEHENWIEPIQYDIIRAEMYAQLYDAIQRLPPQCAQVIRMGYLEGKTNPEIAAELGLSEQTIKNHKHRGLNLLKGLISKELMYFLTLCAVDVWLPK